jgi:DNA polymerase III alpha subunit
MTRNRSREEMARISETIVAHAVVQGRPAAATREIFLQPEDLAPTEFNKGHSVCFAVISYATA